MAKSHKDGGNRSASIHNLQTGGPAVVLWFILSQFDGLSSSEITAIMGVGVFIASAIGKFWSEYNISRVILKKLGLVVLVSLLAGTVGCAGFAGSSIPHHFEGQNGETIVACSIKGIGFAFGDSDICRNIEGGHVSEFFKDITLGVVREAARITGGIFGGIGSAITPSEE